MSVLPLDNVLRDIHAVVIGASAGAIAALSRLLPPLAPDCALPILVAVHVPADRPNNIPALLQTRCRVRIKEAEDKEPILPGTMYFAPPDYHLLVERDHRLSLSNEEPVNYSRPSIDVLFESAAEAYGRTLLAIILSGANEDGAKGARAVSEAGGLVAVQSPDSADARLMPEAALAACPDARPMSLAALSELLCTYGGRVRC